MRKISLTGTLLVLLMAGITFSGCSTASAGPSANAALQQVTMAEAEAMPLVVRAAPQVVTDAYRFAAANPEVVKQIPCYCGCGPMGHESNYDCFWEGDGDMSAHALGCGICVDIAQDTLRGLEQGRSLQEIRQQIDADYSRFGPATETPTGNPLGAAAPIPTVWPSPEATWLPL